MEQINLTYQRAKDLIEQYVSDPITKLHLRETEVFMRELAKRLNENEEEWGDHWIIA